MGKTIEEKYINRFIFVESYIEVLFMDIFEKKKYKKLEKKYKNILINTFKQLSCIPENNSEEFIKKNEIKLNNLFIEAQKDRELL